MFWKNHPLARWTKPIVTPWWEKLHVLSYLDVDCVGFTGLTAILPVRDFGEPFSIRKGMMSQSKTAASQQGKEEAENEEDNHRSAPDGWFLSKH